MGDAARFYLTNNLQAELGRLRIDTPPERPGADEATQRNVEAPSPWHMAYCAWQWRRAAVPNTAPGPAPAGRLRPASNDFYARGLYGQYIYIAPDSQTVVVRLGTATGGFKLAGLAG